MWNSWNLLTANFVRDCGTRKQTGDFRILLGIDSHSWNMLQKVKLDEKKTGMYPTMQPHLVSSVSLQCGSDFFHQFPKSSYGALPGAGVSTRKLKLGIIAAANGAAIEITKTNRRRWDQNLSKLRKNKKRNRKNPAKGLREKIPEEVNYFRKEKS